MPRIGANTTEHTKRKSAARKKPLRSKLSKLESKAKVHGRQKRLRHVSAQMKRQRIGLARSARASQPTHEARLASHQCRNKRARRWPRLARDRGKYSCLTSSGLKTTKAADPAKDAAAIRGELVGCGGFTASAPRCRPRFSQTTRGVPGSSRAVPSAAEHTSS